MSAAFLTKKQVAQTLSVSVRTVERRIADGTLAAVLLPACKHPRISREALDEYVGKAVSL